MSIDLKEQERNNTHQWNDPPYHTGNKDLVNHDVVIPMVAQTRFWKKSSESQRKRDGKSEKHQGSNKGTVSSRRYIPYIRKGLQTGVIDMTFDVVSGNVCRL